MEQSSERDQSSRVLSSVSEDVAYLDWPHMQIPSMYDIMFVPLLMFVLCLILVPSFLFFSIQFCFVLFSSVHVLFQTFWSCMFYYFFVLLWHAMFIYTSLCTLRHYLYQNVLDYKTFSSPLAKPKMIYDPFPYPFVFRQEAPFNVVIPFEGPLFLSPYSYSKIAELEFLVTKCNSCCCHQQIHVS